MSRPVQKILHFRYIPLYTKHSRPKRVSIGALSLGLCCFLVSLAAASRQGGQRSGLRNATTPVQVSGVIMRAELTSNCNKSDWGLIRENEVQYVFAWTDHPLALASSGELVTPQSLHVVATCEHQEQTRLAVVYIPPLNLMGCLTFLLGASAWTGTCPSFGPGQGENQAKTSHRAARGATWREGEKGAAPPVLPVSER